MHLCYERFKLNRPLAVRIDSASTNTSRMCRSCRRFYACLNHLALCDKELGLHKISKTVSVYNAGCSFTYGGDNCHVIDVVVHIAEPHLVAAHHCCNCPDSSRFSRVVLLDLESLEWKLLLFRFKYWAKIPNLSAHLNKSRVHCIVALKFALFFAFNTRVSMSKSAPLLCCFTTFWI